MRSKDTGRQHRRTWHNARVSFSEAQLRERAGEAWPGLDKLLELWGRYGRAMNLSGARSRSALIAHCVEAWLAVEVLRECAKGANPAELSGVDVGAGGGFPGLVLAAALPSRLTLVEPREKRAAFLEMALATIGRADVEVRRARLGERGWEVVRGKGGALAS